MAPGDERSHVGQPLRTLALCALYRRTLVVTCRRCRRVKRFAAIPLWELFRTKRWDDRLPQAMQRLYCPACLEAHGVVVRPRYEITSGPADPEQPPWPDDRTWKHLVRRHRA